MFGTTNPTSYDAHMRHLSSLLDMLPALINGPCVYLDYPVHNNVGDLLIWEGALRLLERAGKMPFAQYSAENAPRFATEALDRCSTICLHGGGNFGDLWPRHQLFREDIIARYPGKRIIIFPQSVFFQDRAALEASCARLKKHPDLHIFVRDEKSLELLRGQGLPHLALCPDTAHALWGHLHAALPCRAANPLLFLRDDKEKADLPEAITEQKDLAVDWSCLWDKRLKVAYRFGCRVDQSRHRIVTGWLSAFLWRAVSSMFIRRAVRLFAPHELIVTDRLHAMILAALLRRRAVVYDNSYGKVSSYAALWFKALPTIDVRAV